MKKATKIKTGKTTLQFKFALMFLVVMLVSSIISLAALMLIMRPSLVGNLENQIVTLANSMKRLESVEKYTTSEIISICNNDTSEVTVIKPKSTEYYRVKIEASEHNCYVVVRGFVPTVVGYTVINGEYLSITSFAKDNYYWMTIMAMLIALMVSIILGSVLTVFLTRRILRPVRNLTGATAMVSRGHFNVTVPLSKDTELNVLINNFNKMAQELSGIESLRGDFISNVSHEFKTPLASIQGFAKLLQDDNLSDADRRDYTQIIVNETGRLSKLTTDILRLSKLENQTTVSNKTRFSIDEQIRRILLVLEPEWTKKNIELNIELDSVYYFGSEELMAQIWQNIINNAIKFTPENGHIGVRLFRTDKNITVRISDDGPQIPPEVAEKIFDKFYQGDNSRKTEGNGLGLALVRRVVDLCGGKIFVENLYDGGVCFVIELPYVISDMQ